jgi:hypothetical protein
MADCARFFLDVVSGKSRRSGGITVYSGVNLRYCRIAHDTTAKRVNSRS